MTQDDLPTDQLRCIARKFGLEVARDIWKLCRGNSFDVPMRLPKSFCIRYIGQHWDGRNVKTIAYELGITPRCVYNYLNDGMASSKDQLQLSL